MTRRTLTILIALVLAAGLAAAVIATSITERGEPVHTLPGGETHTGELPPSTAPGQAGGQTESP